MLLITQECHLLDYSINCAPIITVIIKSFNSIQLQISFPRQGRMLHTIEKRICSSGPDKEPNLKKDASFQFDESLEFVGRIW